MQTQTRNQTAPPAKKNTPVVLLVIALVLLLGMTVLSLAAAVFLFVSGNAAKTELSAELDSATADIATMKRDAKDMANKLQAMETDKATLESRLSTLADGDIAAIKDDIVMLKNAPKEANPGLIVSELSFSFSDTDKNYDYYYGTATVTASDTSTGYVVLLKQTWKAGGTPNREIVQYFLVAVADGTGKFYTTDWNEKGKLKKPSYTYEVVGFIKTTSGK